MITLRRPDGSIRQVLPGEVVKLAPGEVPISSRGPSSGLINELESAGIRWGDLVARATSVLGISHCSKCEERRKILNQVRKLGIKEVIRRMKGV